MARAAEGDPETPPAGRLEAGDRLRDQALEPEVVAEVGVPWSLLARAWPRIAALMDETEQRDPASPALAALRAELERGPTAYLGDGEWAP